MTDFWKIEITELRKKLPPQASQNPEKCDVLEFKILCIKFLHNEAASKPKNFNVPKTRKISNPKLPPIKVPLFNVTTLTIPLSDGFFFFPFLLRIH